MLKNNLVWFFFTYCVIIFLYLSCGYVYVIYGLECAESSSVPDSPLERYGPPRHFAQKPCRSSFDDAR